MWKVASSDTVSERLRRTIERELGQPYWPRSNP